MDNSTPPEASTGDSAHTYLSKAPARRGRTRDSNPHPCVLCKHSHLKCNALPPFSRRNCERCFLGRLICEQPVVGGDNQAITVSDPDTRFHRYATMPSRKIARRKSSTKNAHHKTTKASAEATGIPSSSNTENTEKLQTQLIIDQPKKASLFGQEIVAQADLSPIIEHSMYGPPTDSFTSYSLSSYRNPLESFEPAIGPLSIYGYSAWVPFSGDDETIGAMF